MTSPASDDDASFDIGASDGQLKTKSGVDYGSKSRYTVTLTATDGGSLTDEITVTINTTEVNDPPVFDDSSLVTELDLEETHREQQSTSALPSPPPTKTTTP